MHSIEQGDPERGGRQGGVEPDGTAPPDAPQLDPVGRDADDPAALAAAARRLGRGSVMVVGDVMLDRYVYGAVERISPEAPIPILRVEREVAMPGGAGNVVRNLTALGTAVAFVSVVGDDQAGSDLTGLVGGQPGVEPWLLVQGGRATTVKTRYVSQGQQLLRSDREVTEPIHDKLVERMLKDEKLSPEQVVERLYVRCLIRKPTPEETASIMKLVNEGGANKLGVLNDLFWALLNSQEFTFNH